jgi:hypothetical protein
MALRTANPANSAAQVISRRLARVASRSKAGSAMSVAPSWSTSNTPMHDRRVGWVQSLASL